MVKLGLALGSGAARGYAHIAVIEHLLKQGIAPAIVSGSSAGALIGACYCLHGNLNSLLTKVKSMDKKDFLRLIDLNNPKISIIKGNKIKQFLDREFFKGASFDDLRLPFIAVATNLATHKTEYITKGKLIDAVMASICIPGLFPPYKIKKQYYIDGGALEPVPVDVLFGSGCNKVIAVNINRFIYKKKTPELGLISILSDTFYMMMEKLSTSSNSKHVFYIKPKFTASFTDSLNFYKWQQFYQAGEREIKKSITAIKKWLC